MIIKNGDKVIKIPAWLIVLGILAVDNLSTNVMKVITIKSNSKK